MSPDQATRRAHTRKASRFVLESLESRVLLSADLTAAIPVVPAVQNVDASASVSVVNATQATAVLQATSAVSPHLSYLSLADFGRTYAESPWGSAAAPSRTEAVVQWYAQHVDLTEQQNTVAHFRQYNPTMQSWQYALDLYQFESEVGNLPESSFLHVSEPTSVTLKDIYGNVMADYTIPTGGRFEAAAWTAKHFPFNLKDPNLRAYNTDRILNLIGGEAGVFLDAHATGFADTYNVGTLTTINYGGGIQEYGGRRPGDLSLDADYNADVVNWLSQLRGSLSAAGKWGAVNLATYLGNQQSARDQAIAIGGFDTENLIAPDALRGPGTTEAMYDLTQRVTASGGTAIITGKWNSLPANYAPGDYGTAEARQDMWKLSFYYLVKEAAGSPGKAYLDLNLQSLATNYIPADQNQWEMAYQVDVGQPTGGMTVAQSGSSPSDGASYTVFTRSYTNAKVLFRAMDQWNSTDYGDRSAVTVPLNGSYRQLRADGSLGPVTNSVQIRNAEGLILLPESSVTSNAVANTPSAPPPSPVTTPPPAPAADPTPVNTQPAPVSVVTTTPPAGSETKTVAEILASSLLPTPLPSPTVSTVSNDTTSPPPPIPVAPPPSAPDPVVPPTPPAENSLYPSTPIPPNAGERSYTVAEMLAMDWRTTL
jgi:hypothetical protein